MVLAVGMMVMPAVNERAEREVLLVVAVIVVRKDV